MIIKIKDKEYSFDGYVNPINSVQQLAEECYQQGREDERKLLEIAFNRLFGSEYSWWEVITLAEQLKENSND